MDINKIIFLLFLTVMLVGCGTPRASVTISCPKENQRLIMSVSYADEEERQSLTEWSATFKCEEKENGH